MIGAAPFRRHRQRRGPDSTDFQLRATLRLFLCTRVASPTVCRGSLWIQYLEVIGIVRFPRVLWRVQFSSDSQEKSIPVAHFQGQRPNAWIAHMASRLIGPPRRISHPAKQYPYFLVEGARRCMGPPPSVRILITMSGKQSLRHQSTKRRPVIATALAIEVGEEIAHSSVPAYDRRAVCSNGCKGGFTCSEDQIRRLEASDSTVP